MKKMLSTFRALLAATILYFIGRTLFRESHGIDWQQILNHYWLFFFAVLLGTVNAGIAFYSWWRLLIRESAPVSMATAYRFYNLGSLTKYLPAGKIWQFVSLAKMSDIAEVKVRSMTSMLCAAVIGMQSGAIVSWVGFPQVLPSIPRFALLGFIALVTLGFVWGTRTALFQSVVDRMGERFKPLLAPQKVSGKLLFELNVWNALGWLAHALACLFLLRIVNSGIAWEMIWFIVPCYFAASWIGYFSFLTPSGIGVTEGVLAYLLTTRLTTFEAAFVVLNFRITLIAADLLFALPLALTLRSNRVSKLQ